MADLTVDYAALDRAQLSLRRILTELEQMESHRDALEDIWGSDEVRGAMSGFAGNWDRHREQLAGSVRSVGEMCAGTAETFRSVESALADALTSAAPPPPPEDMP